MIWLLFFLSTVILLLQIFVVVFFVRVLSSIKEDLTILGEMIQQSANEKSNDVAKKLNNRLQNYLDFSSPRKQVGGK